MKQLTLKDKQTLIVMLHKHYAIEEEPFISSVAETEEEKVELMLKAFSLEGRTAEFKSKLVTMRVQEQGDLDSETRIVQIDQLSPDLCLIKAVREKTSMSLAESKCFVDTLRNHLNDGTMVWLPFKVGDTPDCKFTKGLWTNIVEYMKDNDIILKWHYV